MMLSSLTYGQQSGGQQSGKLSNAFTQRATVQPRGEQTATSGSSNQQNTYFPTAPLSTLVDISGANTIPISSRFDITTNSRATHFTAVDPDDPNKIHFIATIQTDNTIADTMSLKGHAYTSRRVQYTYSADGGVHWTAPVLISTGRLGYPDITLYKRAGKYVPIISAHSGPNVAGVDTVWYTQIFIEQGNPGDGNFKKFEADRKASDGSLKNIGFPSIVVSAAQDKLYVLGCILPQGATPSSGPLEFGTFSLDQTGGATWNGWKVRPGGDGSTAKCAGGQDIIHISSTGKLGVFWAQSDNNNRSLYFVESNDGGASWTPVYTPFYVPDVSGPAGSALADYDGFDFFYDKTGRQHFMWQTDYQLLGQNTFYPYTAMILYWGMGDTSVKVLNVNGSAVAFSSLTMFDTTFVGNVTIVNTGTYFTAPAAGSNIEPTGNPFVSEATVALSSVADNFMVFYSTFQDGDEQMVDQDGKGLMKTYLFRNIYFQETKDNGETWSEPAPFRANDPAAPVESKFDFHHPSTAYINPSSGGQTNYQVCFAADSVGGQLFGFETAGWTFNTWYHQSIQRTKVSNGKLVASNILGQNYPNPVSASTTIPVTLSQSGEVTLTLEDVLGRSVKTIFSGTMTSGNHNVSLTSGSLSPGVYRYTIRTRTETDSRLLTIVR